MRFLALMAAVAIIGFAVVKYVESLGGSSAQVDRAIRMDAPPTQPVVASTPAAAPAPANAGENLRRPLDRARAVSDQMVERNREIENGP